MKALSIFISLLVVSYLTTAQNIQDFKLKNQSNQKDRTTMLDIYRAKLYSEHKQEFVFVVNHFKVGNNYAWLMADVQRKDGKKIKMNYDGDVWDCCHVEALFKKSGNKWLLVESGEFSTDVWWEDLPQRYPKVPTGIFY